VNLYLLLLNVYNGLGLHTGVVSST